MESEPTTWRGVIAHWKEGRGQVREASCELFRSCDSIFAIIPIRAAVRHADCHRHELVRTIKLCANCDVALATARCSYLTELQMGDLHGMVPRLRRRYVPRELSACRLITLIVSCEGSFCADATRAFKPEERCRTKFNRACFLPDRPGAR